MFMFVYLLKKIKYKIHLFFKIAWKHKPNERLRLSEILSKLETLYNKYYVSSLITSTFEEEEGDDNCNDHDEESSTEESSKNSIPFEQGIIFHKEGTTDSRKKGNVLYIM